MAYRIRCPAFIDDLLGHSSLSATGRYLKLTAEAFPDLVDQINRIYADIIPDLEVKTEYEDD